jgi:hypothetical protein
VTEIGPEEAILRAREALRLPASAPAQAFRVDRLDPPGLPYFLVLLAIGGRDRHVALIDARTGALDQSADLSGAGHAMLSMEQAIAISKLGGCTAARLVWRPCRASYSPLYPIWEIASPSERRYVDQQGRVWDVLPPSGRGGGS